MSAPISSPQNKLYNFYSEIKTYIPPVAISAGSIVPVFWLFKIKSAQQSLESIPKITPWSAIKDGIKASPLIGGIVGGQMLLEMRVNAQIQKIWPDKKEKSAFMLSFFSAGIVGALSAPMLAAFNAKTMDIPLKKAFSLKLAAPIGFRETAFLVTLSYQNTNTNKSQSKAQEYFKSFFQGAVISACGHPADTILTLWQKNKKLEHVSQLKNGLIARSLAIGIFNVLYKFGNENLKTH